MLFALFTMFGVNSYPNPEALDQAYNPQHGEELDGVHPVQEFLLKSNFRIHTVTSFDASRFINEGLAYLKEHYAASWNKQWDAHWTKGRLKQRQLLTRALLDLAAKHRDNFRCDVRPVTLNEVTGLLNQGKAVMVHLKDSKNGSVYSRPGLVYAKDGEIFQVYMPSWGRTNRSVTPQRLAGLLYPDSAIHGIDYP